MHARFVFSLSWSEASEIQSSEIRYLKILLDSDDSEAQDNLQRTSNFSLPLPERI